MRDTMDKTSSMSTNSSYMGEDSSTYNKESDPSGISSLLQAAKRLEEQSAGKEQNSPLCCNTFLT